MALFEVDFTFSILVEAEDGTQAIDAAGKIAPRDIDGNEVEFLDVREVS